MGDDDDALLSVGSDCARLLQEWGLDNNSSLLDIGSGYGRLAFGLMECGFRGEYHGVDILPAHVKWCQDNIPNFNFQLLDVKNDRYNPSNSQDAATFVFPFADETFSHVCLFSVFTHVGSEVVENYINEIRRMLKPGGRCIFTVFLTEGDNYIEGVLERAFYNKGYLESKLTEFEILCLAERQFLPLGQDVVVVEKR
jgi:SAM-dependent methyltransferase